MIGVDQQGVRAVRGDTRGRHDADSPGMDELTGLGAEAERDAAIVALSLRCRWSSARLARMFGLSSRRINQVVAAFNAEFGEVR